MENFADRLVWPVMVNRVPALFICLFGILSKVWQRIRDAIADSLDNKAEYDATPYTGKDEVDDLIPFLRRGCHSFDWFRKIEKFRSFTDEDFDRIIRENPNWLKRMKIISRSDKGHRNIPGKPGMKLTTKAKKLIEEADSPLQGA